MKKEEQIKIIEEILEKINYLPSRKPSDVSVMAQDFFEGGYVQAQSDIMKMIKKEYKS